MSEIPDETLDRLFGDGAAETVARNGMAYLDADKHAVATFDEAAYVLTILPGTLERPTLPQVTELRESNPPAEETPPGRMWIRTDYETIDWPAELDCPPEVTGDA